MKILKQDFVLHDINAHALRGEHFFKSILDFRSKILPANKHRIRQAQDYRCVLCGHTKGKLALEWQAGYQLFQCENCEAVSPNISVEDTSKHVDQVYNNDIYYEKFLREIHQQYEYRKKRFGGERYSYIIERLGLDGKKIKLLDVGCGAGYFLSYLQDKGIDARGLEVTPHLVRYCKETGLQVESHDLSHEPDEAYDVIVMFDVLEHLYEPIPVIQKVFSKLKPGGYFIAYTPNIHSVGFELMGAEQNTLLPFEHLCFYNENSLKYLSQKTGFTLHTLETFGWDIMDYLLMKEYEDKIDYTEKLREMMILLQGCLDKMKISNHFRITFKRGDK